MSKKELTIIERIERLERHNPQPPGTVLSRCMINPKEGTQWNLGLGKMSCAKTWFREDTIELCLLKAEKHFGIMDKEDEEAMEETRRCNMEGVQPPEDRPKPKRKKKQ